jgi:ribosome-associated protein
MKIEEYNAQVEKLKRKRLPKEIKRVVQELFEKKAEKIVVINLLEVSDVTDYLIICQGNSSKQNQAISDGIQRALKKEYKYGAFGVEGERTGEWILLDYVNFVVHVFFPDVREKFNLEKLWMDAKRTNFYLDQ